MQPRSFNTAGPMIAAQHYQIPPLERLDREDVLRLIREAKYFLLRAPRRTGKTTCLLALQDLLNGGTVGSWRALYVKIETDQAGSDDTESVMRAILSALGSAAQRTLGDGFVEAAWPDLLQRGGPDTALGELLAQWAARDPRPLVLLVDEIDALVGDTLLSVLRQLRAGHTARPHAFPQSVILCGVRDIRRHRVSTQDGTVLGGSAFSIYAESLRLRDFTREETQRLLAQHTEETGQVWDMDATEAIGDLTRGQPWLVNALADEVCFKDRAGRDRSHPIPAANVFEAKERLILKRATHLDQLAHKLEEDRVRRIVGPLLSGDLGPADVTAEDIHYCRDLGILHRGSPMRIANPIYGEVIPRDLTWTVQERIPQETPSFADPRAR